MISHYLVCVGAILTASVLKNGIRRERGGQRDGSIRRIHHLLPAEM